MSRVAVIDYGSGNLRSAAKAFERAASETGGDTVIVTSDPEQVRGADRVVLPGVGAFADCRRGLAAVPGSKRRSPIPSLLAAGRSSASASACN